jgi:hypothetical protein
MALFTLENLKTYLGISGTSEDVQLDLLVGMVDGLVKKYTRRDLEQTTYTNEIYDGPGTNSLLLNQYPVESITSVIQHTETISAVTLAERENGESGYYLRDAESGILWNNDLWDRGRGIIQVTYKAGYYVGTTPPTGSFPLPDDLLYACYEACRYFRNVGKKAGLISESLGRYSYTLASSLGDMQGELTIPVIGVKNVLDRYRRPDLAMTY